MKVWWFVKCLFGFGSVIDGSICWFSRRFYDVHDYWPNKGGDGYPEYHWTYICHKCGAKFTI